MSTVPELDPSKVAELGARLRDNVARAVKAPERVLRDVLIAMLAEGHVLIGEALMRAPDPEAAARDLTHSGDTGAEPIRPA